MPGRLVRKMLSGGALLPVITQYIHSSGGERETVRAKYAQLLPRVQQAIMHSLSDMKDVPS